MNIVSRVSIISVVAITLSGCVSPEEYRSAVSTVDSNWQNKNDKIMKHDGQRLIQADRFRIFTAARGAFRRIGMVVEKQDYGTGFLFATASAPVPLTPAEWDLVQDRDTPEMQRLAARDMGPLAYFASLDPVGKEVLANVFIAEKPGGVEVSLGLRLRNNANVVKGLSNRTQVPPTALHYGLRKFWTAFDRELALTPKSARRVTPRSAPHSTSRATVRAEVATHPVKAKKISTAIKFGDYHALIIGINKYQHLNRLETATADARAVARLLKSKYGFKTQLLINPNRRKIINTLDGLRGRLKRQDNLLIYYAGHGWLDKDADEGYWLPADAKADRRSEWMSNANLTSTLRATKAKHVMVVADSCYSGRLVRGIKIKTGSPNYFQKMSRTRARVVITSGGLEPVADGNGSGHSPFADAFLKALRQNKGVLDGMTLFSQIRGPVMMEADQTPQFSNLRRARHEGGDFLFVSRGRTRGGMAANTGR